MRRETHTRWCRVMAAVALGLALSGRVLAMGAAELARYEAYLVVYSGVAPEQLIPDDLPRAEVIDLKYRLVAGEDGATWLESLGEGHRYRAMGRHPNDDTEFELDYREGEYRMLMQRPHSGERAEFRLYPLERVDLAFYRTQRLGRREMFYDPAMIVDRDFARCDISYRAEGEAVEVIYYDQDLLLDSRDAMSQQDDQLVYTPEYGVASYALEYALAGDHSTRLVIWLERGHPADYASAQLLAFLNRVYECELDSDGELQPSAFMRRWLETQLPAERE